MAEQVKVSAIKVDFGDHTKVMPKGKVSKLDPTQDSFTYSAPAPKGLYDLELAYSRDGLEACPIDDTQEVSDNNVYYKANLECTIVNNEEQKGNKLYPAITTRIGRGKELSTMADLIIRMGGAKALKPEMSDYDVAELFDRIITKNKVVIKGVECDWEGWSKTEQRTIFRTMTDFPANSKGGYEHQVIHLTSKREKEEVNAQLKVKKWPMVNKPSVDGKKTVENKPVAKKPMRNLPVIEVVPEVEDEPFDLT